MQGIKTSAAAASAAYRNVNKKLAKAVGIDPVNGSHPSADFEVILDSLPLAMQTKALEWYERGIKRGIAFATDKVVDGTFQLNDEGELEAPDTITVRVRTKFPGEGWKRHEVQIECEEVGFAR